ncbi:MAG TPA: alpha-L-fucosidase [Chryseolinea sp.]
MDWSANIRLRRSLVVIGFNLFFFYGTFAQEAYLPTVESLSRRKPPEWFGNAKLGIFIHWGLYSVPAWARPDFSVDQVKDWKLFYRNNPYAEWYLNSLRIAGSPTAEFHKTRYGADFDYYNFRDTLAAKTENWKADEWAKIFKQTGARYVVITSKHSDGFVMYPSNVPHPFFNKQEITSGRDFIGELEKAARAEGLKFGVYYSGGLDWSFNHSPVTNLWPDLFQNMPTSVAYTAYADSHMHELIRKYKPDVLWNDVNYPKNGDFLGIFSELFNVNPDAVINDRWQKHEEFYDYTTPEYEVLDSITQKKWETCRGIGFSFGYNRNETDEHLLSSDALIDLLIDIVSKNGNLLLNVGPSADGTIPENQLLRLKTLGEWMKVNSEGIYGTVPWTKSGETLKDGTRIRYTKADRALYIFLLDQPKGEKISIPELKFQNTGKAALLGKEVKSLRLRTTGTGVEIDMGKIQHQYATVIRLDAAR